MPLDAQLPAWLGQRALHDEALSDQSAEQLGQTAGLGIQTLLRMAGTEDTKDAQGNVVKTHPNFEKALGESRSFNADPQWKLHQAQAESQTWANIARAQETWLTFQDKKDESKNYTEDLPKLQKWQDDLKKDPNTPTPAFQSRKAMQQAEQISRSAVTADLSKQRNDIAKNKAQQQTDWANALAATDDDTRYAIGSLDDAPDGVHHDGKLRDANGYILNDDGQPTILDPRAKQILDKQRAAAGMSPFGVKASEMQKPNKAQSPLGKLQADRDSAAKAGAPKEVLDAYDSAIKKQSGEDKEPKMMNLPNGQTAVWIPGSKGLHVLKDEKKEAESKAAYEDWKQSLSAYNYVLKTSGEDAAKALNPLVDSKRKALNDYWKETEKKPDEIKAPSGHKYTIEPE